ncbi:hypothetical protein JB92DRAFT_1765982 [Gautieria morchelliformis]|nr:hypothetical protein JB92DRAFT_1765982 [Gautieria morchelliformis]
MPSIRSRIPSPCHCTAGFNPVARMTCKHGAFAMLCSVQTSALGSELNTGYLFDNFASLGTFNTTQLVGVPWNQTIRNLIIKGNSLSVSLISNFHWTVEVVPL